MGAPARWGIAFGAIQAASPLAAHGLKDLWQHPNQFVANTQWWPPFCLVVDWVAAAIITVEIVAGVHFHS